MLIAIGRGCQTPLHDENTRWEFKTTLSSLEAISKHNRFIWSLFSSSHHSLNYKVMFHISLLFVKLLPQYLLFHCLYDGFLQRFINQGTRNIKVILVISLSSCFIERWHHSLGWKCEGQPRWLRLFWNISFANAMPIWTPVN